MTEANWGGVVIGIVVLIVGIPLTLSGWNDMQSVGAVLFAYENSPFAGYILSELKGDYYMAWAKTLLGISLVMGGLYAVFYNITGQGEKEEELQRIQEEAYEEVQRMWGSHEDSEERSEQEKKSPPI
ncbi:hypothetical protein CW714_10240 [Methanophagales archaeon]|nr:MAG: hypothetical protein CW714_10240 [Methanophagales archaeon]